MQFHMFNSESNQMTHHIHHTTILFMYSTHHAHGRYQEMQPYTTYKVDAQIQSQFPQNRLSQDCFQDFSYPLGALRSCTLSITWRLFIFEENSPSLIAYK